MAKKFLLYARVSPKGSTWAAEETSIGVQFADMRAYILRDHPDAEFIEVFDEFKSGKNLKRPGVQSIMADLDKRPVPWDCLVVWNLDRLSRSLQDALPIFQKLYDSNCEIISINQAYLSFTGAMARYMLFQTIAIAELERGMTSERVSAKMRYIAEAGKIPWGNIPLGYVRDPKLKNTVVIDPEKAEIVREIFKLYISGKLGYEKVNTLWPGVIKNRAQLYKILRQPLYIGELHYAGSVHKTEHPPIIDRETFEKVQKMLSEKKRKNYERNGVEKYEYLLSGLVRCHCGRHMTGYSVHGRHGKKFFYYKCTSPTCKNAINAERLDEEVLKQLVSIYTDREEIKKSLEFYLAEENKKNEKVQTKTAALAGDLRAAKEKEDRIKGMFLSGVVTPENSQYWNDELLSARATRETIEKEVEQLNRIPEYNIDEIFPTLLKAAEEWSTRILSGQADYITRRNLINSMIKELECLERSEDELKFKMSVIMTSSEKWWAMRDSNPRHSRCKRDALTN